jgi:hypothetical protein
MTFSAWPDEKKVALLSRLLSRDENVPLHEALNRIAAQAAGVCLRQSF